MTNITITGRRANVVFVEFKQKPREVLTDSQIQIAVGGACCHQRSTIEVLEDLQFDNSMQFFVFEDKLFNFLPLI